MDITKGKSPRAGRILLVSALLVAGFAVIFGAILRASPGGHSPNCAGKGAIIRAAARALIVKQEHTEALMAEHFPEVHLEALRRSTREILDARLEAGRPLSDELLHEVLRGALTNNDRLATPREPHAAIPPDRISELLDRGDAVIATAALGKVLLDRDNHFFTGSPALDRALDALVGCEPYPGESAFPDGLACQIEYQRYTRETQRGEGAVDELVRDGCVERRSDGPALTADATPYCRERLERVKDALRPSGLLRYCMELLRLEETLQR